MNATFDRSSAPLDYFRDHRKVLMRVQNCAVCQRLLLCGALGNILGLCLFAEGFNATCFGRGGSE
jgi:hypothetical protein